MVSFSRAYALGHDFPGTSPPRTFPPVAPGLQVSPYQSHHVSEALQPATSWETKQTYCAASVRALSSPASHRL